MIAQNVFVKPRTSQTMVFFLQLFHCSAVDTKYEENCDRLEKHDAIQNDH